MRPAPTMASLSKTGSAIRGFPLGDEFLERRDDRLIGLLRADGEAQELAHAIGADGAQNESARGEEAVRVRRRAAGREREADGDEIGDARQNLEPEPD